MSTGCGKSTSLRLLAGLESPSVGEIAIENQPIAGASLKRDVVFQDYGLVPWMTAGENIMLALKQCFPSTGGTIRQEGAIGALLSQHHASPRYTIFSIVMCTDL